MKNVQRTKELSLQKTFSMPRLGFGTYGLEDSATQAIATALETGYRHIDTADVYGSHPNVAEAFNDSGLARDEVFITTKLWSEDFAPEKVRPAVERFLEELDMEYVDLVLMHRPSSQVPVGKTLGALDELRQEGLMRHIGVSNFESQLLREALDSGYPVVNKQIKYHVNHQDEKMVELSHEHDIIVTAYSPLGVGEALDDPVITQLAEERNITSAQAAIQWLLDKNLVVIPRSESKSHIRENHQAFQMWLQQESK